MENKKLSLGFWGFWISIALINAWFVLPQTKLTSLFIDQSETIYHARELVAGRVPHRDIFNHHFMGYVLPFYLVELITDITPQVYVLLAYLFNFINAILVYKIVSLLGSRETGLIGAIMTSTIGWFPGWDFFSFNVQFYLQLFIYLYFLLIILFCLNPAKKWIYGAAFTFGLISIMDQRLLAHFLLLLVPLLTYDKEQKKSLNLKYFLLSLFIIPVLYLSYLAYNNAFDDFIQQCFIFPLFHRNKSSGLIPLNSTITHLLEGMRKAPLPVFLLFLVSFLLMLLYESRKVIKISILILAIISFAATFAGGHPYSHYWMFFAPTIIITLSLLPFYLKSLSRRISRLSFILILLLCTQSISLIFSVYTKFGGYFWKSQDDTMIQVAQFINERPELKSHVFVWGLAPQIYLKTNSLSQFRDMGLLSVAGATFNSRNYEDQGILPQMESEFKNFLENNPPKVFVVYQVTDLKAKKTKPMHMFPSVPFLNMDLEKVDHLSYIQKFLNSNYSLLRFITNEKDNGAIFIFKKEN